MEKAVPSSTNYKNKWALSVFGEWQFARMIKVPILDPGGAFKDYDLHKIVTLSTVIEEMDALNLNYWLSKFVMELAKKEKITEVSSVLGPSTSATEVKISEEKDLNLSRLTSSDAQDVVSAGPLHSRSFANCSVKIKVQYLQ